jgi:hypothetical protein
MNLSKITSSSLVPCQTKRINVCLSIFLKEFTALMEEDGDRQIQKEILHSPPNLPPPNLRHLPPPNPKINPTPPNRQSPLSVGPSNLSLRFSPSLHRRIKSLRRPNLTTLLKKRIHKIRMYRHHHLSRLSPFRRILCHRGRERCYSIMVLPRLF